LIYNIIKANPNQEYVVVSTDKDMFQLMELSHTVFIYNPIKKVIDNRQTVEERFGIPIKFFAVYKALMGDKSDNIGGMRGVGPVTAVKLVEAITDGEKYMELSDKEQRFFRKMASAKFKEIHGLVKFKGIKDEEIQEGLKWNPPESREELNERIMVMCETFGFQKFLDTFESWVAPFEELFRKSKK